MEKIIVYTDGGSRGNPGHAGIGVVINDKKYSEYIGIKTNNQAEYMALIFALKKIKQVFSKNVINYIVDIYMDSELIVKQMNNEYKVNENLALLYLEVHNLIIELKTKVNFRHVLREDNKLADSLVNQALDEKLKKTSNLF
ncbi:MAG: ribonuclease HI family protein [Candidatus Pacebacteria bacterium]|nr:ribonuclease HI family protein [Candidatus Paceibacterota bacterium]